MQAKSSRRETTFVRRESLTCRRCSVSLAGHPTLGGDGHGSQAPTLTTDRHRRRCCGNGQRRASRDFPVRRHRRLVVRRTRVRRRDFARRAAFPRRERQAGSAHIAARHRWLRSADRHCHDRGHDARHEAVSVPAAASIRRRARCAATWPRRRSRSTRFRWNSAASSRWRSPCRGPGISRVRACAGPSTPVPRCGPPSSTMRRAA